MSVVATTLLFDVTPAAAEDGTVATLLLDVRPSTTTPPHLLFDVTQVVGALDQLQPGGTGVRQTTEPQIIYSIRGTDHTFYPAGFADGVLSLELTPDADSWGWSFEDKAEGSSRATWLSPTIGWPIEWGTVAPGSSPIAFNLRYLTAGLEWISYPLMAEGITKSNSSDLLALSAAGVGPEGRWDGAKVSLFLDAEHGWTHGRIANFLLANAHDPEGALVIAATKILFGAEIGSPLNNPVDLDCVNAWETAKTVLDQANHQLTTGAATDLTATVLALPKAPITGPSKFTIGEGDLLADNFKIDEINADHPTCIIVTANALDDSNPDGSVTSGFVELIFDIFAVEGAFFTQTSGSFGAVSGVAGPLTAAFLQLKERRTHRTTTLDGCPVREETTVEGYRNVEGARYEISAATTDLQFARRGATLWIKAEDAVDLDSARAYLWRYDRFTVISRTIRILGGLRDEAPFDGRLPAWVRDEFLPGQTETFTFTDPATGVSTTLLSLLPAIRDNPVGRQIHELTYESGWLNPPVALKTRADEGDAWDVQNYINGTLLDSRLNGVALANEKYFSDSPAQEDSGGGATGDQDFIWRASFHEVLSVISDWDLTPQDSYAPQSFERWLKFSLLRREYVEGGLTDNDEGGYLTRDFTFEKRWERFPGSTWLYGDGFEGRDYSSRNHRVEAKEKRYEAVGGTNRNEIETERQVTGDLREDFPRQKLGLAGYLPAMPVCNRDLALRDGLVPLRVKICLNPDEEIFIGREEEIGVDYIETAAGLEEYAIRLLREITAIGVQATIPADARLVPMKPGTFDFPRRGYTSRRCWVERSRISTARTAQGLRTIMEITLKVPVV